jgi:hypothetical protein
LLLVRDPVPGMPRVRVGMEELSAGDVSLDGPLSLLLSGNAMAPLLPLFEALALRRTHAMLGAGNGQALRIAIAHE